MDLACHAAMDEVGRPPTGLDGAVHQALHFAEMFAGEMDVLMQRPVRRPLGKALMRRED